MRTIWRRAPGAALVASCVIGSVAASGQPAGAAKAPAPQALAYVANGQVTVFEAGTLTTVGPGQSPAWSPNGANVLFMRADFVANLANVFVADTHGANARSVLTNVYPYIAPAWSPDSKYILYTAAAKGSSTTSPTVTLEARAYNVASRQVRVLGRFSLSGGCSPNGTALRTTMTAAQGTYQGTPSTLIWAQPSLIVVQGSCTGSGLLMFKVGGKPTVLSGWSSAVLSPNGKTIAAAVVPRGGKPSNPQVGLINVTTGRTQMTVARVAANALAWTHDGKYIITVADPSNPATGTVQIARLTADGKTVTKLGSFPAAGAYHPSIDATDRSLALAVVGNASAAAVSPPSVSINLVPTTVAGPAHSFFIGSQPAWRP